MAPSSEDVGLSNKGIFWLDDGPYAWFLVFKALLVRLKSQMVSALTQYSSQQSVKEGEGDN